MQTFTTYREQAEKVADALTGKSDTDWKMIANGQRFDISDGYDLMRNDNLLSLYNKVRMLTGTPWQTNHPGVPLDRIQITRWVPDTCDCVTTYTWDRDAPEDTRESHPHRGEKHCHAHQHLRGSCHDHCHELWAENQHKNHTLHAVAESMKAKYARENRANLMSQLVLAGEEATEDQIVEFASHKIKHAIKFEHKEKRGKRTLHIEHPEFDDHHVRGQISTAISSCPHASKRDCHIVTKG